MDRHKEIAMSIKNLKEWESPIIERFLEKARSGYLPGEWYCPSDAIELLRNDIRDLLALQRKEDAEKARSRKLLEASFTGGPDLMWKQRINRRLEEVAVSIENNIHDKK